MSHYSSTDPYASVVNINEAPLSHSPPALPPRVTEMQQPATTAPTTMAPLVSAPSTTSPTPSGLTPVTSPYMTAKPAPVVRDYDVYKQGVVPQNQHRSSAVNSGNRTSGSSFSLMLCMTAILIAVIILLIIQVIYTSLSYNQLKNNPVSNAATVCPVCPVCNVTLDTVTPQDLANAIAALASMYAPNADALPIRGTDNLVTDPVGYTPVFDFNAPHSTDLITPYGYAKVANIENYPATHNQAISQTLFQLEIDGSNSPHHHPEAVEILFVFQGTIEVTRIEQNGGAVYTDVLTPNMTVIFPRGHIHFQHNIGNEIARYISTLNSEFPGVMSEAQRLCELPLDAILSMFPNQTSIAVWNMCGNGGTPIPANPIHYIHGNYPYPSSSSSSSSSSTGGFMAKQAHKEAAEIGEFFSGPDMQSAREALRRKKQIYKEI